MRTDPTNVWQIKLSGANATLLGGLVNFISLAEELGVAAFERWVQACIVAFMRLTKLLREPVPGTRLP